MRQTTLALMDVTMVPFEKNIEDVVAQFESQLKLGFGGTLPSEASTAVETIEQAFRSRRELIESCVAALYEKHFSDQEILSLLDFYRSAVGTKLHAVSAQLQYDVAMAVNVWVNESMHSIEHHLTALLGTPEPAPMHAETPREDPTEVPSGEEAPSEPAEAPPAETETPPVEEPVAPVQAA